MKFSRARIHAYSRKMSTTRGLISSKLIQSDSFVRETLHHGPRVPIVTSKPTSDSSNGFVIAIATLWNLKERSLWPSRGGRVCRTWALKGSHQSRRKWSHWKIFDRKFAQFVFSRLPESISRLLRINSWRTFFVSFATLFS